jgi:acyl carrier protein
VDRTDIYEKVVSIVAHILKISKEAIHEQSNLESLGADSLNRVEFIMELEETFSVEINDEEAEKLSTVGETVDYISQMLKK